MLWFDEKSISSKIYFISAGNEQVCLSEQMLLDCGGGSCSGGSLTGGYKVIEKEHGVASQSDYPYSAHEGKKTCIFLRLKITE